MTTIKNLSDTEYAEKYTPDALRQMLHFAVSESNNPDVMREVPKIRAALGMECLSTAEMREQFAQGYAAARDPFPYESDRQQARAIFDAWLADHDANR